MHDILLGIFILESPFRYKVQYQFFKVRRLPVISLFDLNH